MKIAFVIGRFQPLHLGHELMIEQALSVADLVVVVIGDTGCKRDIRNPWRSIERTTMIQQAFAGRGAERLRFVTVDDVPYDDEQWKRNLISAVGGFNNHGTKRFLVGHKKDSSSFYLDMFPEWELIEVERAVDVDATAIRNAYFALFGYTFGVSAAVGQYLHDWSSRHPTRFAALANEREAVMAERDAWDCGATRQYGGPILQTVDVMMCDPANILLIRRGRGVGEGALALPGGYVNADETLVAAAIRELKEETSITLDPGRIPRNARLLSFDHPRRAIGARKITHVLPIQLAEPAAAYNLQPRPGDDAAEAMWVPIADLRALKRQFFSDHYHIIHSILSMGAPK